MSVKILMKSLCLDDEPTEMVRIAEESDGVAHLMVWSQVHPTRGVRNLDKLDAVALRDWLSAFITNCEISEAAEGAK